MTLSFNAGWFRQVTERLDLGEEGYAGIISYVERKGGLFANWELRTMPGSLSEEYLGYAVKIGCGAWGHSFQHLFLDWANQTADRTLADPRFGIESENPREGWKTKGIYPGNHGATLAAAALSRAMRDDDAPTHDHLVQAANEIVQTALEFKGDEWNHPITQGEYLRAIQLLLIAGELEQAKVLFKTRRNFKYVKNRAEWLKTFIMALPDQAATHTADIKLTEQFDQMFDLVRDPDYKPPKPSDASGAQIGQNLMLFRLELALIKQRYVLGLPYRGQWQHIIGLISA